MTNQSLSTSEYVVGYSEAFATWAVRYIDPSGFECMLSLQAETGSEVLKKAESAITHLVDAKCIPLQRDSLRATQGNNGNKPGATIMVKTDGKNPVCPIHGIEMKQWSKNGRTWYSHRWNDGWCDGKKP